MSGSMANVIPSFSLLSWFQFKVLDSTHHSWHCTGVQSVNMSFMTGCLKNLFINRMKGETVDTLVAMASCTVCRHMAWMCEEIHHIGTDNTICPTWWHPPLCLHVTVCVCKREITHMWQTSVSWWLNRITSVKDVSATFLSVYIISVLHKLEELWKVHCVLHEFWKAIFPWRLCVPSILLSIEIFITMAELECSVASRL